MNLRESYEVLGLPTDASEEEVRRAYKQKARECHPDKNPDDPNAKEKFQTLRQGYERIVSGSSAIEDDPDEQFFGGFQNFFHFVMFHEMMRRRMEEEMMARMFGGLIFDDSDDDDDIPFGIFGMPFFRRPSYHESSSRSHRRRFQENSHHPRSSHERTEGPFAKPPRKEKRNNRKPDRKPASAESSGNGNRPRTTESRNEYARNYSETFDDENSKSKCGQNVFNTERELHKEDSAKPRRAPKTKQKNKNNGQMTSSEWQKGRKHKQNRRKRRNAKFSSQSASKGNAEEPVLDSESETGDTGHHEELPPKSPNSAQEQYPAAANSEPQTAAERTQGYQTRETIAEVD